MEIDVKCVSDLDKNEINLMSTDYLLEYQPSSREKGDVGESNNNNKDEYSYLIPPLLIYKDQVYLPVFGRDIIEKQFKKLGKIRMALSIFRYKNNNILFRYLLFLKKSYLGFNHVEKAIFLKRFKDSVGQNIYKDLEINPKSVSGYEKLLEASDKIKNDLVTGKINEINLFEIFSLFERDHWDEIEDFVVRLKIGTKKRIEVIDMIYDITQRDNLSPDTLINIPEISKVWEQKIDPPQKGERIYAILFGRRYPEITSFKKDFYKRLKHLRLGKDIRFQIPPNFEKWEFCINFNFKDLKEFKERIAKLQSITESSNFEELLKMRF